MNSESSDISLDSEFWHMASMCFYIFFANFAWIIKIVDIWENKAINKGTIYGSHIYEHQTKL